MENSAGISFMGFMWMDLGVQYVSSVRLFFPFF